VTPKEARNLERYLTPAEREELNTLIAQDIQQHTWRPLPGPQTMAYESTANVVGFGGAAGGGKTDLAIGLALTKHKQVQVFRREGPQLVGITDRLIEIVGSKDNLTGKPAVYRDEARGLKIEFNSVPNLGDETKYQGRGKDLLVLDEAANFLESQVRFMKGWVRTGRAGLKQTVLMTFNPPTSAEGRWVVSFFGPWIDKRNPLYPTDPGKLRYCYMDPATSKDVWIPDDDTREFVLVDDQRVYEFDRERYTLEEIIKPESRTFIPSRITDNPFLVNTGYLQQLQAMPEPLRSQMLSGNFEAGMQDDPWQVIPTAWVEAAMARWKPRNPRGEMMAMGVDVARGGKDQTVIATRHKTPETDLWFDALHMHPGHETPNGNVVAGLVIGERRDYAPIHLDVIGVGASPYDVLLNAGQDVYGVNVSERATSLDRSGRLSFMNLRSQLWWQLREALEPSSDNGIALPDDKDLLAELCAPRWEMSGLTIKVEGRQDIVDRVGRSPDRATAIMLALIDVPKVRAIRALAEPESPALSYDPYAKI